MVFGKANGTAVELSAVASGAGGFVMNGIDAGDNSGASVSGAGDVNGDGLADFIVGASNADPGGNSGAGESYVVFSGETPPSSATYESFSRVGDGAGGTIVPETVIGDSRLRVDYSDEDSADNGFGGASMGTVTLHRSNAALSNMPVTPASVYWVSVTDRENWTSAELTLTYLDSEVSGLGAESQLTLYASVVDFSGPWVELPTTPDTAKNELSFTTDGTSNVAVITIGSSTSFEKWVDFAWGGTESGTNPQPYNTLIEAVDSVTAGGTVNIKGDTATSDSSETLTLNKAMTIRAVDGTVTIGSPAARSSRDQDASGSGFVSRKP